MLEFLLCSMVTILPDYLFRRYAQGKRLGQEITFFSVWYELRWGITACAILTVSLVTMIFYHHPSAERAGTFFRTVTIVPVTAGRVEEVLVSNNQQVEAGQTLFRIDDARQVTALEAARSQVAEIDAQIGLAEADLAGAEAQVDQAEAMLAESRIELERTQELVDRGSAAVSAQDLGRQTAFTASRSAAVAAAEAQVRGQRERLETVLPAQRRSAEAALRQAEVELDLTVVRAGVNGTLQQFILQPGDYVSAVLRPAGIIVPEGSGRDRMEAGFDQISAKVLKVGMIGEATCPSKPMTIIPLVVVEMQTVIATGGIRPSDQLVDVIDARRPPGTILVYLEPLYADGLRDVVAGSNCLLNVYTSNHDRLQDPDLGTFQRLGLHAIDTVALVHAFMLRIQALLLPVRTLVLSGGH
jgi:multidrug resistance efflux pump